MANTTTSPNMGMSVPVVGVDPGPDWATNIDACLSVIDGHNHTAGSGVQLTPNAINVNSDFPWNNNNLTTVRSVRFFPQSAALSLGTDVSCLYEAGVDLYFNDGSGNQIRITQGGSIVGTAGSIGGLPNGTASANYAAGTFIWQSATNTSAVMDFGSAILRNNVANSKGLTLAPPNAMGADYGLVLPSLPGTKSLMTLDTSGNMAGDTTADNVTITISANVLQIPSNVNLPGTPRGNGRNIVQMNENNGGFPTTPLTVLRGVIDPLGSSGGISGEGFSMVRISTGIVNITFTTPFFDLPAVTGNVVNQDSTFVAFANLTTSSVTAIITTYADVPLDRHFSIIAIGLRG